MTKKKQIKTFEKYDKEDIVSIKCNTCDTLKTVDNFNKKSSARIGYMSICKPCRSIKSKSRYVEKKEKIKESVRAYRINNAEIIKEKKRIYNKKVTKEQWWRDRHSEKRRLECKKWRESNKEKVKKYNKSYKDSNKELCSGISRRRISSKRTRCLDLSKELKIELSRFSEIVRFLNKKEGKRSFHVDHIIPLNHKDICGLHVPWNLQILTSSENSSKSNKFDGTYENESWRNDL